MNDLEGRLMLSRFDRLEKQIAEVTRLVRLAIPADVINAINRQEIAMREFNLLHLEDKIDI